MKLTDQRSNKSSFDIAAYFIIEFFVTVLLLELFLFQQRENMRKNMAAIFSIFVQLFESTRIISKRDYTYVIMVDRS